jgi:ribonuclease P protein component
MLPKNKRINKETFQKIMKNGRLISNPLFVFRYISQESPQYTFVAPKTVAKRANLRNNLRKQGYNCLRLLSLPPTAGIFFYKKMTLKPKTSEINKAILDIFSKISL